MAVKTNAVKNRFDRKHFLSKNGRQKMPFKNVCRQNLCLIENTSRQKMPVRNECRQILILLKTLPLPLQFLYFRCIDGQLNQFMPTQVKSVKLTLKIRQRSNCRKTRQIEEKIRQMQIKQTSS